MKNLDFIKKLEKPTLKAIHICNSHQPSLKPKIAKEYVFANADRHERKEVRVVTSYIKHLAVSGLSGILARIKSTCNLTGKCFEIGNKNIPRIHYALF